MNVATISPEEFAERFRQGRTIDVIDVRTPAEFADVHLTMARNIPLDRLNAVALRKDRTSVDGEPLYIVCQAGGRGARACEELMAAGYANAVNIEGGTRACVAAGLPVIRGKKTISLERQVRIAAGLLVLAGVGLSLIHPALVVLSALVGAGLVFSGLTDTCGMALLLARMPWNQRGSAEAASCATATN